jgi:3-hydroxyacyl-[acyl-carrier-protein] dehydratase
MIINDLCSYNVLKHVDQAIEATISINENSTVYEGHFPHRAITPGVCQVLMIKEILEEALGAHVILSGAKYIKFTAIHEPGKAKEICAKIKYYRDGERFGVEGLLFKGETRYLKFKGEFIRQA